MVGSGNGDGEMEKDYDRVFGRRRNPKNKLRESVERSILLYTDSLVSEFKCCKYK